MFLKGSKQETLVHKKIKKSANISALLQPTLKACKGQALRVLNKTFFTIFLLFY
tara:strand:+ start:136 stop:297 length:162 start_codon:yes stop_codon:yes gene_type:complete